MDMKEEMTILVMIMLVKKDVKLLNTGNLIMTMH